MSLPVINFAFVRRERKTGEPPKNVHIFTGYFNPINKRFMPSVHRKSCCGNCFFFPADKCFVAYGISTEDAVKKARGIALKLQDSGVEVCGRCVGALYSDGI